MKFMQRDSADKAPSSVESSSKRRKTTNGSPAQSLLCHPLLEFLPAVHLRVVTADNKLDRHLPDKSLVYLRAKEVLDIPSARPAVGPPRLLELSQA